MSQTVITNAFEQWKARQAETGETVLLDEFVFASVPGLDPDKPIDRSEMMPPAAQIVHRQPVTRKGVVNNNAVVHSSVMGADVGDFSFNWIGLINKASGTLGMIVHAPVQQKLKTSGGQQGNVLTRSFLMEFNGAQQETGISTPAETWQIDFTARMAGMDERQRIENIDIYGEAAFFDSGFLVVRSGAKYTVSPGVGYVGGLRASLSAAQEISTGSKPVKVWLDVCWKGSLTSVWQVEFKLRVAESLPSYTSEGVQHFTFAIAAIDASGAVKDLRQKGGLSNQYADGHFLRQEKNLSDLEDVAAARQNLELGDAAKKNTGTQGGTVAAGDDPRILNAFPNSGGELAGAVVHNVTKDPGSGTYWRKTDGTNVGYLRKKTGYDGGFLGMCLGNDSDGAGELCFYNSGLTVFPESFRIEKGALSSQMHPDGNLSGTRWGINGESGWVEDYFNRIYNARFISGMRVGAVEFSALYNGLGFKDVPGYFITGVVNDGNESVDGCQRRPLQFLLDGKWITVGG